MDAYDVFKKLTQGISFKRPKSKAQLKPKNVIENVKIEADLKIKTESITSNNSKHEKSENPLDLFNQNWLTTQDKDTVKKKKLTEEDEANKEKKLQIEEVNHYRNVNRISVVGKHVPDPCRTFENFDVEEDLIENLKKCEYEEPTPVQQQAVPIMLQNRNLLACAPTGSGKTAAFVLPIIHHLKEPIKDVGFRALILCPTRELAKQIQRQCLRLSEGRKLRIHFINKIKQDKDMYGQKSSKKYDIVITTPNRLCFLLNQESPISLQSVKWLIIDEADKLFEEGVRSFREQLDQILLHCTNQDRTIAMFSATHTPVVAKWCVHNMKKLIRVTVGHRNAATDSVDQELIFVGNEDGKLIAFRDIVKKGLNIPALVFVQSKERAKQLFFELIYDDIRVDAIHADRTQIQRDNTVAAFREGKIWVLICTELMARGIDFKGVNTVINYDFPPSTISYVHRIGRAGRAGRKGKSFTFWTLEDQINLRSIAQIIKESGSAVPEFMLKLKKRSKKQRKRLLEAAPKRDDIDTTPKIEKQKIARRKLNQQVPNINNKTSQKVHILKKKITKKHQQKHKQIKEKRKIKNKHKSSD